MKYLVYTALMCCQDIYFGRDDLSQKQISKVAEFERKNEYKANAYLWFFEGKQILFITHKANTNNNLQSQIDFASDFTAQQKGIYKDAFFVHAGYLIGGDIAHLVGEKYSHSVVAFDSFLSLEGSKAADHELIQKLYGNHYTFIGSTQAKRPLVPYGNVFVLRGVEETTANLNFSFESGSFSNGSDNRVDKQTATNQHPLYYFSNYITPETFIPYNTVDKSIKIPGCFEPMRATNIDAAKYSIKLMSMVKPFVYFDQKEWAASIVNVGTSFLGGHSRIIIEGINDRNELVIYDVDISAQLFSDSFPSQYAAGIISRVQCRECKSYNEIAGKKDGVKVTILELILSRANALSYSLTKENALHLLGKVQEQISEHNAMEAELKEKTGIEFSKGKLDELALPAAKALLTQSKYSKFLYQVGGKYLFWGNEGHNCFTWSKAMLADHAGLGDARKGLDKSGAAPISSLATTYSCTIQ